MTQFDVFAIGLSTEAAEALGVGYSPKGKMKGRVAFPVRAPSGELLGYFGVNLEADPPVLFHDNFEDVVEAKVIRLVR